MLDRHCPNFDRAFLVLRGSREEGTDWAAEFGPFIHELVAGDLHNVPEIATRTPLEQGMVFELYCP